MISNKQKGYYYTSVTILDQMQCLTAIIVVLVFGVVWSAILPESYLANYRLFLFAKYFKLKW